MKMTDLKSKITLRGNMARNLYDLENVTFMNKKDEKIANEFLRAGLSFEIDKNSLLWTEGGVFIGYVEYI